MEYSINLGAWNGIFAVPVSVVDKHIRLAHPEFIKVLLYYLRHAGQALEPEVISKELGLPAPDVVEALHYWIQAGVFIRNGTELAPPPAGECSISVPENNMALQPPCPPIQTPQVSETSPPEIKSVPISQNVKLYSETPIRLTGIELAKKIDSNSEIKYLLSEAERILNKLLTSSDTSILVSLYDYAGIPADIITMIIEYCASTNKGNLRAIEKVAYSWIDKGIDSHEKVAQHIALLTEMQSHEAMVKSAFGIWNQALTSNQLKYIQVWMVDWKFDISMVKLAYERTVDRTGKVSFNYINKILNSWFNQGIKTPKQAQEEVNTRKNNTTALTEKTFDAAEFDDMASYKVPNLKRKDGSQL